jgi:hypothetical protein
MGCNVSTFRLCNALGSSRMVGMIGLVLSDYLGGCVVWSLTLSSKTGKKGIPPFELVLLRPSAISTLRTFAKYEKVV